MNAMTDKQIQALLSDVTRAGVWREQGVAFWCLVDMQADGIAWLPGL